MLEPSHTVFLVDQSAVPSASTSEAVALHLDWGVPTLVGVGMLVVHSHPHSASESETALNGLVDPGTDPAVMPKFMERLK